MSQHRILLAEDNKINQLVAAGTLQKLGYAVDIAENGAEAVATYTSHPYDAVLMDVMMPGLDGYQATSMIRKHEGRLGVPPVPIIGLSARAMVGDREIALDAGMDDYLTKPLRTPLLQSALERWIGKAVLMP